MSLHRNIRGRLSQLYGEGEARAMAMALLEDAASLSQADVLAGKADALPQAQQADLLAMAERMGTGEPYHYVVGWQHFCGLRIGTRPGVLIPRPETEALVDWAVEGMAHMHAPSLLDAGTGSGCIALALKHARADASVEAWDISPHALNIARANARELGLDVAFRKVDLLDDSIEESANEGATFFDGIVSNPPYVCESERAEMLPNVLDHEPSLALFVPDEDPLLFYRALARIAQRRLRPGGFLMVEINRRFGQEVMSLFQAGGLVETTLRDDPFGNPRMVATRKPYQQ